MLEKTEKCIYDCIIAVGEFNRGAILKIFELPEWCDKFDLENAIKEIDFLDEPGLYFANIILEDGYINFNFNENIKIDLYFNELKEKIKVELDEEIILFNFKINEEGKLEKIY